VAWRYKRDMRLERNPYYWNPAGARAESIEIRVIEDANTALLAAEAGGIDWLAEVLVEYRADLLAQRKRYEERHRSELDRLLAEGRTIDEALALLPPPERGERRNVHGLKAFGTDFYSFNCRPTLADGRANPFADPRVRRAFALAVDKRLLVERVTRLNEPISNVLVPPDSIPGYDGPEGLPFDPERARRELADAGWIDRDGDGRVEGPDGGRFPTVDLLYSTGNPRYRDLSLALRDMWQSRLGVEVVTRGKETKDFREDLKEGRFMIARGGWYGDYGDPTTWLDLSRSTDGNNDRKYDNPAYDAMLDAAADEPDPARRFAILAEAERFLMEEEIPILPICTFLTVYWYEPGRFTGLTHHPRLDQYLGRIRRVQPGATEAH
jgi:oligopeptide transport system substrate-binding protein